VLHDYAAEDEDLVTTVMDSPAEEEESHTISTVHEPAKSQKPAPTPDDAIVVAPTLLAHGGGHVQYSSQPFNAPPDGSGGYYQLPPSHSATVSPPGQQQRSSVLIAVIAAATTLIALTMTALVVLKITDSPRERDTRPIVATTATTGPTTTAKPALSPTAAPTPTIVQVAPTAEKPLDPSSLPKETSDKPAATAAPKSTKPISPKPLPVAAVKPKPVAKGGGEPGYLTIMCVPGCDAVSAGGRNLGPSPVVRAALSPGNHGVVLRASGKKTKSLGVTIVSGQTTARRVTMD
jgi:hypothetical protein